MTSFAKRMGGSNSSRVSKISRNSGHSSHCGPKKYAIGGSVLDGPPEEEMSMDGGGVMGRLDRPARKSPATVVNVTVAGKSADQAAPPLGAAPSARAPVPPPAPIGPPPGPMGAGGPPMSPGQLPPLPLGPMKNGGRAGYAEGGPVRSEDEYARDKKPDYPGALSAIKRMLKGKDFFSRSQSDPSDSVGYMENWDKRKSVTTTTKRAAGGKVEMDAGAGSGVGRLEQANRQSRKGD